MELNCGIKEGALALLYDPRWIYDGFREIDTQQVGSRFKLNRKFLEDFTLTITYLYLSDSNSYYCAVEIDEYFVEGAMIKLLVYGKYFIFKSLHVHMLQTLLYVQRNLQ